MGLVTCLYNRLTGCYGHLCQKVIQDRINKIVKNTAIYQNDQELLSSDKIHSNMNKKTEGYCGEIKMGKVKGSYKRKI